MEKRIQMTSTILIILGIAFGVYFAYQTLSWIIPFAFTEPERWEGIERLEFEAGVPFWNRLLLFLLWLQTILFVEYAVFCGVKLMNHYRAGRYFAKPTYSAIFAFGLATILSTLSQYVTWAFQSPLITLQDPNTQSAIRFHYDARMSALLLSGVMFCVIGWVMRIATEIKEENEAIV